MNLRLSESALRLQIVNIAETTKPYKYNKSAIDRISNPNKKLRWAVPLIFIAQLALKVALTYSPTLYTTPRCSPSRLWSEKA